MAAARKKRASAKKRTATKKRASPGKRPTAKKRATRAKRSPGRKGARAPASPNPRSRPSDKAWRELLERAIEKDDSTERNR